MPFLDIPHLQVLGRRSGFVALMGSLSSGVVDICLIPEIPFEVDGPHGLLAFLERKLEEQVRTHACSMHLEGWAAYTGVVVRTFSVCYTCSARRGAPGTRSLHLVLGCADAGLAQ